MRMFHVKQKKVKEEKNVFIRETESVLREKLGTTVLIKRTKKKGKLKLNFSLMKI